MEQRHTRAESQVCLGNHRLVLNLVLQVRPDLGDRQGNKIPKYPPAPTLKLEPSQAAEDQQQGQTLALVVERVMMARNGIKRGAVGSCSSVV